MGVMEEAEEIQLATVAQWRAWLAANHARTAGVWLVSYKPRTGKPAVDYDEAVCEALCFGWIDATVRSLDDERSAQWWSPRRKGSMWARSNKARVERMEAQGRMTDAGRAVIERAKADGSWDLLEPVEALIVPDDLAAAFALHPGATQRWDALSPTAKREFLVWIVTAKRPATRAQRVDTSAGLIATGRRLGER